jgi:hypothetical protein
MNSPRFQFSDYQYCKIPNRKAAIAQAAERAAITFAQSRHTVRSPAEKPSFASISQSRPIQQLRFPL